MKISIKKLQHENKHHEKQIKTKRKVKHIKKNK